MPGTVGAMRGAHQQRGPRACAACTSLNCPHLPRATCADGVDPDDAFSSIPYEKARQTMAVEGWWQRPGASGAAVAAAGLPLCHLTGMFASCPHTILAGLCTHPLLASKLGRPVKGENCRALDRFPCAARHAASQDAGPVMVLPQDSDLSPCLLLSPSCGCVMWLPIAVLLCNLTFLSPGAGGRRRRV